MALLVRSDFPPKKGEVSFTDSSTVSQIKEAAAEALKLNPAEYLLYSVSFGSDVIDLSDVKLGNSRMSELGIKAKSFLVLAAGPTCAAKPQTKQNKPKAVEAKAALSEDLDPETVLAQLDKMKPAAKKSALEWIDKKMKQIIEASTWTKAPRSALKEVLKRDTLKITEADLFQALLKWARASIKKESATGDELKKAFGDLLPLIRFPTMSSKDIAAKIVPLSLLEGPEILGLFSFIAQTEAGGKPALPAAIKQFSVLKRKSAVELKIAPSLSIVDRTVTSTQQSWRCVRGTEVWSTGVNEYSFIMKVRGYSSGTSLIVGIAPDTINMEGGYPGTSRGMGIGIGDQGSNFGDGFSPSTTSKKSSGRYFDEGDVVRIVYDCTKQTLNFYNGTLLMCGFTGVSGPMCPVVSMYGTSVVEWID